MSDLCKILDNDGNETLLTEEEFIKKFGKSIQEIINDAKMAQIADEEIAEICSEQTDFSASSEVFAAGPGTEFLELVINNAKLGDLFNSVVTFGNQPETQKHIAICEDFYHAFDIAHYSRFELYDIAYIYLDLNKANNSNIKDLCNIAFVIKTAAFLGKNPYSSEIEKAVDCVDKVFPMWDTIVSDLDCFLPDIDNLKVVDVKIVEQFIKAYADRAKHVLMGLVSIDDTFSIEKDGYKIGMTYEEKIQYLKEQMEDIASEVEEQLREENGLFTNAQSENLPGMEGKEFMVESFDLDASEYEKVENYVCPFCKSDNILAMSLTEYYCYDCEKTWKMTENAVDKIGAFALGFGAEDVLFGDKTVEQVLAEKEERKKKMDEYFKAQNCFNTKNANDEIIIARR